ncbi:prolyl 4-hydroxylase subunit alpha-1-like [Clavelina lepadiformis]|uniref:prolyl 4-hydroxylase subunit alpha-1-like n=1 Tax=Clavelina lepadiformis TaxID=159417 RepID=UPI00404361B5
MNRAMSFSRKSILLLYLLFLFTNYAKCEWFSSLSQMEDLVHDEIDLLSSLRDYINAEETKIMKIKRLAEEYQQISESARTNIDEYLGHPVNQYRLVKRLASEWSEMEDLVMEDVTPLFLTNLSTKRANFPNEDDVKGSAQAIIRLQETYRLKTHDLVQGIIKGIQANQSLTADDCYDIGRTAYLEQDFYHCALWMNEVSNMPENGYIRITRFDVLDHLSYCMAQQGNIERAYEMTSEMIEIDPTHPRIVANHKHYRTLLGARKKGDDGDPSTESGAMLTRNPAAYPEFNRYERLCRLEQNKIPKRIEKKLKCYYWTNNNHPRLILQPTKLEELWHSPHLVRFHDVITDKEVEEIKAVAKPRLNRATVQNPSTGKLEHAHYRVSKSAWLSDSESPAVARVSQRISDITGLSMETAEQLQIANYGVGGQYEPHYDFARESDAGKFEEELGNRIATFLIYLTDVENGGSTVFLHPGIAVRPIRGSAAFWYNLYPSGEGDLRTRHAACPVLTGVKWVSNKWIHERDQEFHRKCALNKNSDNRMF